MLGTVLKYGIIIKKKNHVDLSNGDHSLEKSESGHVDTQLAVKVIGRQTDMMIITITIEYNRKTS